MKAKPAETSAEAEAEAEKTAEQRRRRRRKPATQKTDSSASEAPAAADSSSDPAKENAKADEKPAAAAVSQHATTFKPQRPARRRDRKSAQNTSETAPTENKAAESTEQDQ